MESTPGVSIASRSSINVLQAALTGISDARYTVKLAEDRLEAESALRLRYEVFNVELGARETNADEAQLEFDAYDLKCRHLLVVSKETGKTVGTYRLNSIETASSTYGFYSANEFTIETLPREVIHGGIEIGRACIAREHRNTKVLFLLLKALHRILRESGKRYFFGCCSIFTGYADLGRRAFRQLVRDGYLHPEFSVEPCRDGLSLSDELDDAERVELPALFSMYLRIGARICGPPMVDRRFGTIDFFVVFDLEEMNEKYRRLFS